MFTTTLVCLTKDNKKKNKVNLHINQAPQTRTTTTKETKEMTSATNIKKMITVVEVWNEIYKLVERYCLVLENSLLAQYITKTGFQRHYTPLFFLVFLAGCLCISSMILQVAWGLWFFLFLIVSYRTLYGPPPPPQQQALHLPLLSPPAARTTSAAVTIDDFEMIQEQPQEIHRKFILKANETHGISLPTSKKYKNWKIVVATEHGNPMSVLVNITKEGRTTQKTLLVNDQKEEWLLDATTTTMVSVEGESSKPTTTTSSKTSSWGFWRSNTNNKEELHQVSTITSVAFSACLVI